MTFWIQLLKCCTIVHAHLQILFVFSFSACHSLRSSEFVTVFTVTQLKKSTALPVFAVRQFEVEHMSQHVFLFYLFAHNLLCSRFVNCYLKLCKILLCICQPWFSCSSSYLTLTFQLICPICWLSCDFAQRHLQGFIFVRVFKQIAKNSLTCFKLVCFQVLFLVDKKLSFFSICIRSLFAFVC